MTDNESTNQESSPESNLSRSLSPVQYMRQLWLAAVHVCVFVGIFLTCGLMVIGLDYLLPLPWWVRGGLLLSCVALAFWAVQQIYGGPLEISYSVLASKLETIFPGFKDRLVTAVEVAEGRTEPPDSLREYILQQGVNMADRVSSVSVLNREYPLWTALVALIPLVVLFMTWTTYPTVIFRHGARFILPGAQIPPVTDTRLHLPDRVEVIRGNDAKIPLRVSGEIPDKAQLFVTYPDGEWTRRSMQPLGRKDGYFRFKSVIGRPDHSFEFYVKAGDATSFTHEAKILIPPKLKSPQVELDPPAYTDEPTREFKAGPVRGLKGSTVTVRTGITPSGSQVSINVVDSATRTVSMEPDGDTLTGKWTLRGNGHWLMLPVSPDGVAPELEKWKVRTIPDHPPEINVDYPPEEHEVSAVSEVPVVVKASDDYGLQSVRLLVGMDSEPATTFARESFSRPYPSSADVEFEIPLENHQLKPGDFVSYRVEARDGNHVSGPGVKTTSPRFLEVKPFDQYQLIADESGNQGDTYSEREMREVILKLEKIIDAQKTVFNRTAEKLADGRNPGDSEYLDVRDHQFNVRDASDSLIKAIDKFIQQDEVKFPEDEYLALRDAIDQMERSAQNLTDHKREESLGHQRQTINLLNRQLQWLRLKWRQAQQMAGAGQVSDQEFDSPDTLPEAPSGQAKMREYSEEVKELMDQAKNVLDQYQKKEEMEETLSEMGPAGLQHLRDLLKNIGSLSPSEREELARMAKEMNLTEDPGLLTEALEALARAGESRATLKALWNGELDEALKRMENAGLSEKQREEIVSVFKYLKPCRITDSCEYGPVDEWEALKEQISRTMKEGDGPLPGVKEGETGDSLAELMEDMEGGGLGAPGRGELGQLAEQAGYADDGDSLSEVLRKLKEAGSLQDVLNQIERGKLDEARQIVEDAGIDEEDSGDAVMALARLKQLKQMDRAANQMDNQDFEKYQELARNADRLNDEELQVLADLAEQGGMCSGGICLSALRQLQQSGRMGQVIRQLARGQPDQARETMEETNMSNAQQQAALNILGPANGAQGQGLADTMRSRIRRAVASDTGGEGRQFRKAGSVVEKIRNVRRELRILHRLLKDRENRSGAPLELSEKEDVPEDVRDLVRDYFRRLNEQ